MRQSLSAMLALSLGLGACATQPRSYVPTTLASQEASDAYRSDFAKCAELARAEGARRKGRGAQVAAGGAGAGAGAVVGVGAASSVVAVSGLSGGAAGVSSAAATSIVLLPVALGAFAGVGIASFAIRHSKEKALKSQMQACMLEHGHTVEAWKRAAD